MLVVFSVVRTQLHAFVACRQIEIDCCVAFLCLLPTAELFPVFISCAHPRTPCSYRNYSVVITACTDIEGPFQLMLHLQQRRIDAKCSLSHSAQLAAAVFCQRRLRGRIWKWNILRRLLKPDKTLPLYMRRPIIFLLQEPMYANILDWC